MNKAEAKALWEKVKLNHKRLDECPGPHTFVGIESEVLQGTTQDGGKLYRRYECTKCKGKLDAHGRFWYERGLMHGGKDKSV